MSRLYLQLHFETIFFTLKHSRQFESDNPWQSANKKCKVLSVRSFEDNATAKVLLFEHTGDDLISYNSSSSQSEMRWFW
jgi:hypothetical protein